MADTIRKKIIAEIVSALENATFTALSNATVYFGLQAFDEENDSLPIITVIPNIEESEQTAGQICTNKMLIDILSVAELTDNAGVLAEDILGELIQAVYSADLTTSVNIVEMRYASGGVEQYPDNFDIAFMTVTISLIIEYETEIGNPYNQLT